ncbi:MAG: hypothetical protein VKJ24_08410 [Synechococcales bacterium]|nr:hypothetical protein [Synechococcales bacterium]
MRLYETTGRSALESILLRNKEKESSHSSSMMLSKGDCAINFATSAIAR